MNDSVYLVGCSASNFTGSAYHCSRGPRDARPTRRSSFRLLAMASPPVMLFGCVFLLSLVATYQLCCVSPKAGLYTYNIG
jgi:hypothetical protein